MQYNVLAITLLLKQQQHSIIEIYQINILIFFDKETAQDEYFVLKHA